MTEGIIIDEPCAECGGVVATVGWCGQCGARWMDGKAIDRMYGPREKHIHELKTERSALRIAVQAAFVELARIGGYSDEGAAMLLDVMRKRSYQATQKSVFVDAVEAKGYTRQAAERVFDVLSVLAESLRITGS